MKKRKKYPHYLPEGWTLNEVQEVADYHDNQSDEEGAAEIDEALAVDLGEVVMIVPAGLVARIRKFIAQNGHYPKARAAKSRRVA